MIRSAPAPRRAAAVLVALYGLVLLANAVINAQWLGVPGDWPRLGGRLFAVGVMVYGLWSSLPWARWATFAFSLVFGLGGLIALWAISQVRVLDGRPYPVLDVAVFAVTSLLLLAAATILLMWDKTAGHPAEHPRT